MKLHTVKILNKRAKLGEQLDGTNAEVLLDGKPLKGVTAVDITLRPNSFPIVTIALLPESVIMGGVKVKIKQEE